MIKIKYFDKKNKTFKQINAKIGDNLLTVAKNNDINLEGSCGGEMLCTTCHVHIISNHLTKMRKQSLEEKEILSLAQNLKLNSRLACQITITKSLAGLVFSLG